MPAYEQDEDDCTEGGTLNENGNLYKDYELIETEDPWELFSDDNYELFCFYGSENEKNISDNRFAVVLPDGKRPVEFYLGTCPDGFCLG